MTSGIQGFAVKIADVYGIVYTPQPIVDFMVRSVEEILKQEFSKSLNDPDVVIIDPFVGTGSFITRIMQEIKTTSLEDKYINGLHCNDIMLLPYYISCLNIEHEYYERTKDYLPFSGACLVDTFDLAEEKQSELSFAEENTERIEKLKTTKLFVIISNPPYNASQINENDNNKNKRNPTVEGCIRKTYIHDSKARLVAQLRDPYVKAIRWASDKIIENGEGVIAFITNNRFINGIAFDGMRKHLANDFELIYLVDLKGNIREDSMKDGIALGEKNTVFGLAAMVGISINFFIKKPSRQQKRIFYSEVDFRATREEKFSFLNQSKDCKNVNWTNLLPDSHNNWLTDDLEIDYENLIPLGSKEDLGQVKKTIFSRYSQGTKSNNDSYVYNSNKKNLEDLANTMVSSYNSELDRWIRNKCPKELESFLNVDETKLKWVRQTKLSLTRGVEASFDCNKIRVSMYRPFFSQWFLFDRIFNECLYRIPQIFPDPQSELENQAICITAIGVNQPFHCLITSFIPDFHLVGDTQCFSFYVYNEDGSNRRENITDWALEEFRKIAGLGVTKWDIFYYVYGLLHCQDYRDKYAANLKIELPRIPLPTTPDNFRLISNAGKNLTEFTSRI